MHLHSPLIPLHHLIGVLGWLLVVVLFAPIRGGSLGICFICWMLCTALYGSTSLQQSSKGSCSLLVSGYNLRADCQWRTLVLPLNSGANAAPASVFREQGAGPPRGNGRKTRSNRWDLSNFWNGKIVWALCIGTGRGESSWPSLSFKGNKKCEFVEHKFFEYFGQTSKSVRYAGWFSPGVQKIIVYILKWMWYMTGRQCNCFSIGRERL